MPADALAVHYAKALADAVFAPNSGLSPKDAVDQFRSAEGVLTNSKPLHLTLLSPAVNKQRKQAVITKLSELLELNRVMRNFLLVVIGHRRLLDLKSMRESFEEVVDERLGWVRAEIASAHEVEAPQREEIERALGTQLGKFIRATYVVDPSLIGGVRARVASKEYDATVRGKLENMRQRLAANL
jgi:F-type H+-transporting ATPase subunit delta